MNTILFEDHPQPLLKRLRWQDWLYAIILCAGALFAYQQYGAYMDAYEKPF